MVVLMWLYEQSFSQTVGFIVVVVSKVAGGLLLQRVEGFLWHESHVDRTRREGSGWSESRFWQR